MDYIVKFDYIPANDIKNTLVPPIKRQETLERTLRFYSKLEQSILDYGFRNPIVVSALKKDDIRIRYGGSRLLIGQKHDLLMPCIISDYDNIFLDAEILQDEEHILTKFLDKPTRIEYQKQGLICSGCEHSHLSAVFNKKTVKTFYIRK